MTFSNCNRTLPTLFVFVILNAPLMLESVLHLADCCDFARTLLLKLHRRSLCLTFLQTVILIHWLLFALCCVLPISEVLCVQHGITTEHELHHCSLGHGVHCAVNAKGNSSQDTAPRIIDGLVHTLCHGVHLGISGCPRLFGEVTVRSNHLTEFSKEFRTSVACHLFCPRAPCEPHLFHCIVHDVSSPVCCCICHSGCPQCACHFPRAFNLARSKQVHAQGLPRHSFCYLQWLGAVLLHLEQMSLTVSCTASQWRC